MKTATKFSGLFLSTLVCILIINSFSSVQGIGFQYVNRHVDVVDKLGRASQSHISILDEGSQPKFSVLSSFEPGAHVNLESSARFKWLDKLIRLLLQRVEYENNFILRLILSFGTLILQLLSFSLNFLVTVFLNPVSVVLFAVWGVLKKFFQTKWEEIPVEIPIERVFRLEAEDLENSLSSKSLPRSSKSKRFGMLRPQQDKRELKENKNEALHGGTTESFSSKADQSRIDTGTYGGSIIKVPRRIYEGDYCLIDLDLSYKPVSESKTGSSNQESQDSGSLWKTEKIKINGEEPHSLELELSSPKFETDNPKKQSKILSSNELNYHWNCKISGFGKHRLELFFNVIDPSNPSNTRRVGRKGWDVQVVGIPGLNGNQFRVLQTVLPLLSLLWGVFWGIFTFVTPKTSTPTPTPPVSEPTTPAPPTSSSEEDSSPSLIPGFEDDQTPSLIPDSDDQTPSLIPDSDDQTPSLIPDFEDDQTPSLVPAFKYDQTPSFPDSDNDQTPSLVPIDPESDNE